MGLDFILRQSRDPLNCFRQRNAVEVGYVVERPVWKNGLTGTETKIRGQLEDCCSNSDERMKCELRQGPWAGEEERSDSRQFSR